MVHSTSTLATEGGRLQLRFAAPGPQRQSKRPFSTRRLHPQTVASAPAAAAAAAAMDFAERNCSTSALLVRGGAAFGRCADAGASHCVTPVAVLNQ